MPWTWQPLLKLDELAVSESDREFHECWKFRDGLLYFSGGRKLSKVNPDAFEVLCDPPSFVARDNKHIYHGSTLKKDIDRATFEPLGDFYFRDSRFAYAEYETSLRVLKGEDGANFEHLGYGYARDSDYGYFWGRPLRKCTTPLSLRVIPGKTETTMEYAMDDEFIYSEGAALKNADLSTWEPHECGFSVDQKRVFYDADPIAKVDRETWEHISSCYSRDKNHVFYMRWIIKEADVKSWCQLDDAYSADDNHVFFCGDLLDGADATTFEVSADGIAKDRYGIFNRGERMKN